MEGTPDISKWIRNTELYKAKVGYLLNDVGPERHNELHDLIAEHVKALEQKYPDARNYAMFHAISGSSLDPDNAETPILHEDFPGEDSIASYIDNVIMLG